MGHFKIETRTLQLLAFQLLTPEIIAEDLIGAVKGQAISRVPKKYVIIVRKAAA